MKKRFKTVVLSILLVVFSFLVIIPSNVHSRIIWPGWSVDGTYGPTCACPIPFWSNCTCILIR
jgi:hypothetical protein